MLNTQNNENEVGIDRTEVTYSIEEKQAAQRAMIGLFGMWGVQDEDVPSILCDVSVEEYKLWKIGQYGHVSKKLVKRMMDILSLHRKLRQMFTDPKRCYIWMGSANANFQGQAALDILKNEGGEGVIRINKYLNAVIYN